MKASFLTSLVFLWVSCLLSSNSIAALPTIPIGAIGVIEIDQVQEGNLVYLKGMKGEGRYVTRNQRGELCEIAPVPFLAGGFNGHQVSLLHREPILLSIYSADVDEQLRFGKEVTSQDAHVRLAFGEADIVIDSGLGLSDHFILNPRPVWSSWWRLNLVRKDCEPLSLDVQ